MGLSRSSRGERHGRTGSSEDAADLGTQLEDLVAHVMRCERWARLDARIDLSLAAERLRRPRGTRPH